MSTWTVAYRPAKRPKDRPWVLLIGAWPKPLTTGRYPSKAEALDAAHRMSKPGDKVLSDQWRES